MGVRATVPAGLELMPMAPVAPIQRSGGQREAVQVSLHPNPVEFDGIETRVVELLPDTEEFQRVPVAQPVSDEVVGVVAILVAGNVRERYVVVGAAGNDGDRGAFHFDLGHVQFRSRAASSLTVIGGQVLVGMKISCLPRWAKSDPSALKADEPVSTSKRKSRHWNLPLPR